MSTLQSCISSVHVNYRGQDYKVTSHFETKRTVHCNHKVSTLYVVIHIHVCLFQTNYYTRTLPYTKTKKNKIYTKYDMYKIELQHLYCVAVHVGNSFSNNRIAPKPEKNSPRSFFLIADSIADWSDKNLS